MPLLIGAALALAVALLGRLAGLDRDRAFYCVALIVIGTYYILFAVLGGAPGDLATELVIYVPFAALAVAGFRTSMWLVVAGLAAHGVLDIFYFDLVASRGVPAFWPSFCLAYDLVAAACLAALILWRDKQETAAPDASPPP